MKWKAFHMPGLVLHAGTSPAKLVKQKDLCLDFFRNGTRFPKACTSIRDYVSDAYHREMTFKKDDEVKIWVTSLHSLDSLVLWDQRVWNGDMANAKLRWEATQTETEMLKTMLQKFWDVNTEAESEPTRYRHVMFIFFLWSWFFAIVVSVLFRQVLIPWTCHCNQIHVLYISFLRILIAIATFRWTSKQKPNRLYTVYRSQTTTDGKITINTEWNSSK